MAESVHTALQPWQTAAFVAAIVCVVVGCIPAFAKLDLPTARRIYWCGWLGAAVFGAAAASSRGWSACLAVAVLFVVPATLRAYFTTEYIRVGGRVITHATTRGVTTAAKQWWVFAALACILGGAVYTLHWDWRGLFAIAFLAFLGALTGHDDSSRNLPLVRGQRIPAFVVLVASIPMFLIPPAAYLAGYQIGKRHPHKRSRHDR